VETAKSLILKQVTETMGIQSQEMAVMQHATWKVEQFVHQVILQTLQPAQMFVVMV
jgi:hypothetical protein